MTIRNFQRLAIKHIQRYKRDKEGATAIEFALLAIPFFMLLFAILELAIIFFISSTLSHAVSEAGRQIRTGNFQNCGQAAFKASVCDNMAGVGNCNRLRLDVVSGPSFGTITVPVAPDPPTADPSDPDADPTIPDGLFVETGASVPVVVQALYYHRLILPPQLTLLENLPGQGVHLITSTTALLFKMNPFRFNPAQPEVRDNARNTPTHQGEIFTAYSTL